MAQEKPGQTLEATALVHEAYLRLVGNGARDSGLGARAKQPNNHSPVSNPEPRAPAPWSSRGHFFAAAADGHAANLDRKRPPQGPTETWWRINRVQLTDLPQPNGDERLLALDEAVTALAEEDPQAAQVVELHHFAGLSHDLVAETLGITVYQARQKWTYARAWLQMRWQENNSQFFRQPIANPSHDP